MGRFLMGFVVGGGAVLGALRYHVVRANDGVHFVPKMAATLSDTYVDVRSYTSKDWSAHPAVAAALVRDGQGNLIANADVNSLWNGAEGMLKSLK
ncbi:MAG: hypothetical protein K8T25_18205 [Planctomycetia bacterium]|nr:hypothetical protein [Planctomycetia bacterium]